MGRGGGWLLCLTYGMHFKSFATEIGQWNADGWLSNWYVIWEFFVADTYSEIKFNLRIKRGRK